jgi:hypothetical protein
MAAQDVGGDGMKSFRELNMRARVAAVLYTCKMMNRIVLGWKLWLFIAATVALYSAYFAIGIRTDDQLAMSEVFGWLIWLPSTVTGTFFGMGLVSHERNAGMLETLFTSSPSRYRLWIVKFAVMMSAMCVYVAAIATATSYLIFDVPIALTWLYVMPPTLFFSALTVYLSVKLKSGNAAGLCMAAILVLCLMMTQDGIAREGVFPLFNPLDKPESMSAFLWARRTVVNKSIYLILGGVAFWRALRGLDRRERLLD